MRTELELLQCIYENCCHPGCSHEGEYGLDIADKFYRATIELHYRFGYPKVWGLQHEPMVLEFLNEARV